MNSSELIDDAHCFVCGQENPNGLKLHWDTLNNTTKAEFVLTKDFQGWKGVAHGGILATVLDEAMTRLAWQKFGGAVTAEMTVRYLKPALIGQPLRVEGSVEDIKGRLIPTKAVIKNQEGQILAEATGKAIKAK